MPPAFAEVALEFEDSIANRRAQSDKFRKEMNQIVLSTNLQREMIFGKDDVYFKEGMHSQFKKAPEKMQIAGERNEEIVRLENLHVQLYHSDKALYRWLDLLNKLNSHNGKTLYSHWNIRLNFVPAEQKPQSVNAYKKWVANELACDLSTSVAPLGKSGTFKNTFKPEWDVAKGDSLVSLRFDPVLPISADNILASVPINGQFAFARNEYIPGVGYMVFPSKSLHLFRDLLESNKQFKARWISSSGNISYTSAEYNYYDKTFFYALPNQLAAETVYCLQLIAVPPTQEIPERTPSECWQIIRGKPQKEDTGPTQATFVKEVKIAEIYFRTSKYDLRERLSTLRGTINWDQATLEFTSDEPIDNIEINGTSTMKATVRFDMQPNSYYAIHKALIAQSVYHYLSVPQVEKLDNIPLDQFVTAELDHTAYLPFIRKISLGNWENYPHVSTDKSKIRSLPGNYTIPKMQDFKVFDSLVTASAIPIITKDHFAKKKPIVFKPMACTLYVGELKQLLNASQVMQEQVRRRVDERAAFFYGIDKRRALREGNSFSGTLEQYRQEEIQNMPVEIKTLLEAKFPDDLKKDFTLMYMRYFPGTTQGTAVLDLKTN